MEFIDVYNQNPAYYLVHSRFRFEILFKSSDLQFLTPAMRLNTHYKNQPPNDAREHNMVSTSILASQLCVKVEAQALVLGSNHDRRHVHINDITP